MTFLTRNFDPLTPLAPKFPNFAAQILFFSHETHCCHRHTCTCATKFLHHLGTGCCLPKTTFRTKIGGGLARGTSKNLGPPTYFCNHWNEQLQIWYTTWVWDLITKKQHLAPKLAGVWARGASEKNWDMLFISPLWWWCNMYSVHVHPFVIFMCTYMSVCRSVRAIKNWRVPRLV